MEQEQKKEKKKKIGHLCLHVLRFRDYLNSHPTLITWKAPESMQWFIKLMLPIHPNYFLVQLNQQPRQYDGRHSINIFGVQNTR